MKMIAIANQKGVVGKTTSMIKAGGAHPVKQITFKILTG
jgi:cellulose biosynthesis protein BcsQ